MNTYHTKDKAVQRLGTKYIAQTALSLSHILLKLHKIKQMFLSLVRVCQRVPIQCQQMCQMTALSQPRKGTIIPAPPVLFEQ